MNRKFECIKDFYMTQGGPRRFTCGVTYEVIGMNGMKLMFKNDIGKRHTLDDNYIDIYFIEIDDSGLDFKVL